MLDIFMVLFSHAMLQVSYTLAGGISLGTFDGIGVQICRYRCEIRGGCNALIYEHSKLFCDLKSIDGDGGYLTKSEGQVIIADINGHCGDTVCQKAEICLRSRRGQYKCEQEGIARTGSPAVSQSSLPPKSEQATTTFTTNTLLPLENADQNARTEIGRALESTDQTQKTVTTQTLQATDQTQKTVSTQTLQATDQTQKTVTTQTIQATDQTQKTVTTQTIQATDQTQKTETTQALQATDQTDTSNENSLMQNTDASVASSTKGCVVRTFKAECELRGFEYDEDSRMCFKLHQKVKLPDDARKHCQDQGGDLATPLTKKMREFLLQYVQDSVPAEAIVLLGAKYIATKGMWIWYDGTEFDEDIPNSSFFSSQLVIEKDKNRIAGATIAFQAIKYICQILKFSKCHPT